MRKFNRVVVIVLDSVGIGASPDAHSYGDEGAHTLRHIAENAASLELPHLTALGLGRIDDIPGVEAVGKPLAHYGKMVEASVGKDTMTGHWELMGLRIETPFQVYPSGFPREVIDRFERETGRPSIGNHAASGTAVIEQYGEEHQRTGAWIVYTSADSVLQIAAHENVVPLAELYQACEIARAMLLQPPHVVGRVIARPFIGSPGNYRRTSNRHDYAVAPPESTLLNHMYDTGHDVIAIGKINDIFSGSGITETYATKSNAEGIEHTIARLRHPFQGMIFVNLVDFDSLYGHRRDVAGYAACLEEFDRYLPDLLGSIGEDDLLVITADHGNDPTHTGTDHTREYVPILLYHPGFHSRGNQSIGIRETFADVAATIADNFGIRSASLRGESFLHLLRK